MALPANSPTRVSTAAFALPKPEAIAAMSAVEFSRLSPTVLARLDGGHGKVLRLDQLKALNGEAFKALPPECLAALPPGIFAALGATQLGALTAEQGARLTADEVNSLRLIRSKIANAPPAPIDLLSPSALAALSASTLHGLDPSHALVLAPRLTLQQITSLDLQHFSVSAQQTIHDVYVGKLREESKTLPQELRQALEALITDGTHLILPESARTLSQEPFLGAVVIDSQRFIAAYDKYFAGVIKPHPEMYQGLRDCYSNVASRAYLASNVPPTLLAAEVRGLFDTLGLIHDALLPDRPIKTSADVAGYIQKAYDGLAAQFGKFKHLGDSLIAINYDIAQLQATVIDRTTDAKLSNGVIQWLLDGAPAGLGDAGGIAYRGKSGLDFVSALTLAEGDLLRQADNFIHELSAGLLQVVENKRVADTKAMLAQIFDIFSGVGAIGAGIGKTVLAFQKLSKWDDMVKAASEIGSDINSAGALIKNQSSDWLKPSISQVSGKPMYAGLDDAGEVLGQYLSNLPASLTETRDVFIRDYNDLLVNLNKQLGQGEDDLLKNAPGAKYCNFSDGQFWAHIFTAQDIVKLPTRQALSYRDLNGAWHQIDINVKDLALHGRREVENDNIVHMSRDIDVPGYATARLDLEIVHSARNGYFEYLQLHGYNPI